MQNQKRRLGKIECLELQKTDSPSWIIMFHGYGADANDLFSMAEVMNTKKSYNWLFPNGILEVPIGPGWTGRAWWPVNMQELEAAQQSDFSDHEPGGMTRARTEAQRMIKELKIPWSQIILAGFSQGAMLATDLYLRAEEPPKGLIVLSGTLICKTDWSSLTEKRKNARFFQSHGVNDSVLGIKQAAQLNSLFNHMGLKGPLYQFNGGHEIPPAIISKAVEYINLLDSSS